MDSALDRDAKAWAATIARAYARASRDPVTPETEAWLARELRTPLAACALDVPAAEWPSEFVNPAVANWEVMAHRKPGPRLRGVDYGNGTVTMG